MAITAAIEKRNEDGTVDVRISGTTGPDLWQVELNDDGELRLSWVDEETDEAITAIPDDEDVFEAIEDAIRREVGCG